MIDTIGSGEIQMGYAEKIVKTVENILNREPKTSFIRKIVNYEKYS